MFSIEAGTRDEEGEASSAGIMVSFRTGTDESGSLGSLVGDAGSLFVVQPGDPDAVPIQLEPVPVASYSPSLAEVGQEVFAVVSVEGSTFRPLDNGSQYYLDNAVVTIVPEPMSWFLAAIAIFALVVWHNRRLVRGTLTRVRCWWMSGAKT